MPLSLNHLALSAILGLLPLTVLPQLPGVATLYVLLALSLLLALSRVYFALLVGVALAAFIWGCWSAGFLLQQTTELTRAKISVQAEIVSIHLAAGEPSGSKSKMRQNGNPRHGAVIKILQVGQRRIFPPAYAAIQGISMPDPWCAGQRWHMTLSLRAQHGRLNEGGFDSQRWALANHRPLTGRVLHASVIDSRCSLRQRIVSDAQSHLDRLNWPSILLALAFAEGRRIPEVDRLQLQQTGTAHLMAISGLHISLAALFGWLAARGGQFFLPMRWITPAFPLMVSWLSAAGYVWISGANFPAVRALIALTLWIALRIRGIHCSAWQIWLWCVALIVISDPLSILSTSLWLSCLAVSALIFWFQWAPLPERCQTGWRWGALRWLHLQAGMTLLLLPLQWGLFHGANLLSLPANLWAVPLISFITTPLILAALCFAMFPMASYSLWWLADCSLSWVFKPLPFFQRGWRDLAETGLLVSVGGWLAVAGWRFGWWRGYPLNILVIAALLFLSREGHRPRWRLDMLDVGHGLAVMVERDGKALIYDTGISWTGGDIGKTDIVPYLKWRGLTPDGIWLSHSDRDHIGGLQTLKRIYPHAPVASSYRAANHRPCLRGQTWMWQGLRFEVLWPPKRVHRANNNHSCVIKIDDGRHRVLLTGDIEAQAERALVQTLGRKLQADILQVPHHGSKTSSTRPFLRAVRPRAALTSAARFSPWRLPAPAIKERYRKMGIEWHDTARSGQISVRFYADGWEIKGYRQQIMPRWYHQWFGVRSDNG
ncbi:ComEC family protein [Martelella alba]|uniref:ComEC family protein n=1 Tax=Martelella alba TaxID=2590451 RepID=A0ABY2SNU9_9HYPH|nr:ComEC family protein [Martelella alba]TKI07493.1 ComEC family protein [Martelella alba]